MRVVYRYKQDTYTPEWEDVLPFYVDAEAESVEMEVLIHPTLWLGRQAVACVHATIRIERAIYCFNVALLWLYRTRIYAWPITPLHIWLYRTRTRAGRSVHVMLLHSLRSR